MTPINILVVDDHAIIRDGLRSIVDSYPDLKVVGEAKDGCEAVEKAKLLRPSVVVMDIAMPCMNGIEATRAIQEFDPSIKVMILSMLHTGEHLARSIRAGARGYVLKESAGDELVRGIRAVANGELFFGEGVEPPDGKSGKGAASPLEHLSKREREVLELVVEGKTSAEIAEILTLSPKTVETYRSRLMLKLGINNVPSLVKFAILHGITLI